MRGGFGHVLSAAAVAATTTAVLRLGVPLRLAPSLLGGVTAALVWAAATWTVRAGAEYRSWPEPPEPGRLAGWPSLGMVMRRLEREAREPGQAPRRTAGRQKGDA
jgi:hypothetical protein